MFCPMMIGIAALNGTAPVRQSACRIPTDAEDDWITAVRSAPARTPSNGLENLSNRFVNSGTSASGFTAELIMSMPYIRMAKPMKIVPTSFFFESLINRINMTPMIARIGENEVGLNIRMIKLSLWIPVRLKIQDVTVVPIFAPMITPTAWDSFIIPEFTKPTTITVVADDDCITAVTPAPSNTALIGLDVRFSRIFSSLPPETFARPSPIAFIPYKNSARPPINVNILKKSMVILLFLFRVCRNFQKLMYS